MKCKHCGMEIKKRTNLDAVKECRGFEDLLELAEKICGNGQLKNSKCPLKRFCKHITEPDINEDNKCPINAFIYWLEKDAK